MMVRIAHTPAKLQQACLQPLLVQVQPRVLDSEGVHHLPILALAKRVKDGDRALPNPLPKLHWVFMSEASSSPLHTTVNFKYQCCETWEGQYLFILPAPHF